MDTTITKILLFALACTLVQFSLVSFFGFFGWHPDLIFVVLFLFSFKTSKRALYFFALASGLFVDFLSVGRFGFVTFSFVVSGFALYYYFRHFSFGILQRVIGFGIFWTIFEMGIPHLISGKVTTFTATLLDALLSALFVLPLLYIIKILFKDTEYRARAIQLKLG